MADSQFAARNRKAAHGHFLKAVERQKAKFIGSKFHRLTVLSLREARKKADGGSLWECRCECGAETLVSSGNIGRTHSCGCARVDRGKANFKDRAGERHHKLVAVEFVGMRPGERPTYLWRCQCDCGNEWTGVFGSQKSCGCYRAESARSLWGDISAGRAKHPRLSHCMRQRPGYQKAMQSKRRAWAKSAGGAYLPVHVQIIYEHQGGKCNGCDEAMPLSQLTHDHIKPLSKGGTNDAGNIQLLCGSCNSSKRAKDFVAWMTAKHGWNPHQYARWFLARAELNKRLEAI